MIIAPISEILIIKLETFSVLILLKMYVKRNKPYPPNFSRMAASTIDPAIGASTWAFGSHRCVVNIGNFTKNPNSIIIHM